MMLRSLVLALSWTVASAFTHQSTFWGRTAATNSRYVAMNVKDTIPIPGVLNLEGRRISWPMCINSESACIVAVSEMESCNEAH
jgi:hypothetical protein